MADRLGVDVGVGGFEKFEQHMNRVNELLEQFAAKATQFAASASTFNNAMQVFADSTKAAAAGMVAFRQAARDLSATGKTIGSLTDRITKLGQAFGSFGTSAPGTAGAIGNIAQNLSGIKLPGSVKGQQLTAQAAVREAQLIAERQAEVAEKIRRRFQERQLQDEDRAAKASAKLQLQTNAVAERSKRDQNRTQQRQFGSDDQVIRLADQAEAAIRKAEGQLRGRLADALLNRKDESEIKSRIDSVVRSLQERLQSTRELGRSGSTQSEIQSLRELQNQIKQVTAATREQINVQQKALNRPSVAFLGRERKREQISGLDAETFALGKIAQAAASANPLLRTFARTVFAVEDATAASKLGLEAFNIILRKVLGTLSAISLPARLLIGLFGGIEKVASRAAKAFGLFTRFTPFRGADKTLGQLGSEVRGLEKSFKHLKLPDVGKDVQNLKKQVKQANIEFRTLGFDVAKFDPSKFSQAGRSRGGAQASVAAQAQVLKAQQQIEQQATAQVAQAENVRARIREQIATQSAARQTETTQARIQKLVQLEEQASARIQQVEARRAAATSRISGLQGSLTQAGGAGAKAAADLERTASAIDKVGREAEETSKGISGLSAFLAGLAGGAIGAGITRLVQGVAGSVRGLAGDAINALGEFEAMEASFTTLSRIEILNKGDVTDFAEAEKLAAVQAKELLDFTQKLAIISPFEQEGISAVFRTGLAYEFTSEEARKLTQITVDYAAGTGQQIDAANGITLALGQVRSAGKLTGQELLQLRNNGVPALAIIGKAVGKTTEQLREFIDKGGSIDADLAIGAIAENLATNFAGAAERTSGTIRGLISSLNDLRKVSLRNFVTPIANDVLKPIADQLLGGLLDEGLQERIAEFGQKVATGLVDVISDLGGVFGTLQGLLDQIPQGLFDVIGNFLLLGSAVVAATTAFAVFGPVITFIAAALAPLISVTGALIAAGALLTTAWLSNWLNIRQVTANAVNFILSSIQNLSGQLQAQFSTAVSGAANIFSQGLGQLPQLVSDVSDSILGQFGDLLEGVVEFGQGLIEAFADGIVSAVGFVIDALNILGQVITNFLAPGSPPKLLPDIDKWGTAAANEFLKGFTVADFDLLKDLSGEIETALSSVTDKLDPSTLVKVRETVALAVKEFTDTGIVSPQTLDQVAKASGQFAEEISIIAPAYFKAAGAAKELEAAQEALNDVNKKYEKLLAPIEARLKGIADATSALDEEKRIKQLQNVLNNRFATEEQKRAAALELEQIRAQQEKRNIENAQTSETKLAQSRVDSAEDRKKTADDELEILKRRLQFETDILKALNAQGGGGGGADAEKKAKKLKEKLGELTGDITSLADLELPEIDVEKKIAPVIEGFTKSLEAGRKRITDAIEGFKQDVIGRFTSLRDAFVAGFNGITLTPTANSISDQLRSTGTDALGQFANKLGMFAKDLADKVTLIQKEFTRLQSVFNAGFGSGPDGAKGAEELSGLDKLVFKAGQASASLSTAFTAIVTTTTQFGTDLKAAFEAAAGGGEEGDGGPIGRFITSFTESDTSTQLAAMRQKVITQINNVFLDSEGEINFFGLGFAIGSALGKVIVFVGALRIKVTDAINKMFGQESGIAFPSLGTIIGAALAVPVIVIDDLKRKVLEAVNGMFGESAEGEASPFAQFAAGFYAGLQKELGNETNVLDTKGLATNIQRDINALFPAGGDVVSVFSGIAAGIYGAISAALGTGIIDVVELQKNIETAINGLFGSAEEGTGAAGLVATVKTQLDLLFGNVTFSDLTTSFDNLVIAVKDAIKRITWDGEITLDIFGGLKDAVVGAVTGLFKSINALFSGDFAGAAGGLSEGMESLGGGLGQAIGGLGNLGGNLLAEIDFTKVTAGIVLTITTGITSAWNGVTTFFAAGATALTSGEGGASAIENVTAAIVKGILGIIAGLFLSVQTSLTPENIALSITNVALIVAAIIKGLIDFALGIARGVTEAIDSAFGTDFTPMVDKESKEINAAFDNLKTTLTNLKDTLREALKAINEFISDPFGTGGKDPGGSAFEAGANIRKNTGLDNVLGFNPVELGANLRAQMGFGGADNPIANFFDSIDAQVFGSTKGKELADGVQTGFTTELEAGGYSEMTAPMTAAIAAQASAIGAKSPATVPMEQVGVPLAQGIIEGVKKTLEAADTSTMITAFVAKLRGELQTALAGGLTTATSEAVRDSGGGKLSLGNIQAQLDVLFGKIKFENLPESFENLKTAISDTILALTWEVILPETFDAMAITINNAIIAITWDSYLSAEETFDPFALVVELTLRAIQWATYITVATWRTLAQRIAATLAAIPWATYITTATWATLARRVGDTLRAIDWAGHVTVDTWAKLASTVAVTMAKIKWEDFITAETFSTLAAVVVKAMSTAIVQNVSADDFSGAANAIIKALNSAVVAAAAGLTPVNNTPDQPPPPPGEVQPVALRSGGVLSRLLTVADSLAALQSANGNGFVPIAAAQTPFTGGSVITNSSVVINTEYHLHQTVSESTAARSGRSFQMFQALTGNAA